LISPEESLILPGQNSIPSTVDLNKPNENEEIIKYLNKSVNLL
jgi:hypothetical protein